MTLNSVQFNNDTIYPSKIICVGRNYAAHIEELGNEKPQQMVVFFKPNSAISQQLRASAGEPLSYETEICFMVRNGLFAGVGVGLDLTKRGLQNQLKSKGLPWERAKAFDGSALYSNFVELPQSTDALTLEMWINGVLTQHGNTTQMLYSPAVILEELQSFVTLVNGDIVMTGTPQGVGEVKAGAEFTARVSQGCKVLIEQQWIAS